MDIAVLIVFAYLLGSVPTGYLVASLAGLDIRRAGSGNVGATNVARVVGKKQGLITLLGDVAKGFLPVFISRYLGFNPAATSLAAAAAFVGHLYPVFLRFQGGKGVATALGGFLALAPLGSLALLLVFVVVVLASRIVSLASMVTAGLAPALLWLFSYPAPVRWLALFIALAIVLRHRENIQRLRAGTEPKFNF